MAATLGVDAINPLIITIRKWAGKPMHVDGCKRKKKKKKKKKKKTNSKQ